MMNGMPMSNTHAIHEVSAKSLRAYVLSDGEWLGDVRPPLDDQLKDDCLGGARTRPGNVRGNHGPRPCLFLMRGK